MFLSAAMMLDWLGDRHGVPACSRAAIELTRAVELAFAKGDLISIESGGAAGTDAISACVRKHLVTDLSALWMRTRPDRPIAT